MTRRGFTLVEVIAVMLIMSLAAVVVMPVMSVLVRRIDDSQGRRASAAQLHTALDQVTRVLREWPSEDGELSGLVATRESGALVGLRIPGAGGFRLEGDELLLIDANGDDGVLCDPVDSLTVRVLGPDSDTPLLADEDLPHAVTVQITLESQGARAAGVIFIRSMGGDS